MEDICKNKKLKWRNDRRKELIERSKKRFGLFSNFNRISWVPYLNTSLKATVDVDEKLVREN